MNKKIVIAFYPGGGGNRYLRYLLDQEYAILGKSYDEKFLSQKAELRYLLNEYSVKEYDYTLTHCLNRQLIEQVLKPLEIIFIDTDYRKSLRRGWCLEHDRFHFQKENDVSLNENLLQSYQAIKAEHWPAISTSDEFELLDQAIKNEVLEHIESLSKKEYTVLNSAWSAICWHNDYYKRYPKDLEPSVTVDTDNDEFSLVMKAELENYRNDIFDFCWKVYHEQGTNAPIVDLFDQHKRLLGNC